MPWPNDDLTTDSLDSAADRPSRTHFLRLTQIVKAVLGARGDASGIAPLGVDRKVPNPNLPLDVAWGVPQLQADRVMRTRNLPIRPSGVAPLDGDGQVPVANLPRGDAGGIAPLDGDGQVPVANLPRGDAGGIAPLDASRKVPAANLDVPSIRIHGDSGIDIGGIQARWGFVDAIPGPIGWVNVDVQFTPPLTAPRRTVLLTYTATTTNSNYRNYIATLIPPESGSDPLEEMRVRIGTARGLHWMVIGAS